MPDSPGGGRGTPEEYRAYPAADRSLQTDPTALTTDALRREIAGLRELLERKIETVESVGDEKSRAVEVTLAFLEQQRVEQKADTKTAVDAALSAQKEAARELAIASEKAITKSEATITNALTGLTSSFQTEIRAVGAVIDDLKTRITTVEQRKIGGNESRSAIYAAVGFVISLLVLGGMLAAAGFFGK